MKINKMKRARVADFEYVNVLDEWSLILLSLLNFFHICKVFFFWERCNSSRGELNKQQNSGISQHKKQR
jgi:hypothetical protein